MEKKEAKKTVKKAAVEEKIPQKEYFTVKVEVLAPVTLTYRIYAESPEEAADMAVKQAGQKQFSQPIIGYGRMKSLKTMVYNAGTSMVRFVKNL